jgi:UDP-glucuronate 4-epimerase
MSILVTGFAGFIGSHFCEALLTQGRAVVGLDNFNSFYPARIKRKNTRAIEETARDKKASFVSIEGDIRDASTVDDILSDHKIKTIVHLAAMAGVRPSIENPELYSDVNVQGTTVLLAAAQRHGVKNFIFASSSSVYGNNPKVPFCETDNVDNPISPYAATKKAGELLCHVAHKVQGLNVAGLRFFTVYGPRQRPDLAINKFTRLILDDKEILVFGDGTKARDFTYSDDIVDGMTQCLAWVENTTKPQYEIFNLGEAQTTSVNELIRLLEQETGKKAKRKQMPEAPGDVEKTFADITKAKNILGYSPKTSLQAGLGAFVRWAKEQKDGLW